MEQATTEGVKVSQKSIKKLGLIGKNETSEKLTADFENDFSLKMQWNQPEGEMRNFISVSRAAGGQGQGHGKIVTKIRNYFQREKETFLLEVIPWWLIPELSKMKTKNCKITSQNYVPAGKAGKSRSQFRENF